MSLKQLRKKANLTQKELGALTKFSSKTIGNYETGSIPMSPEFVQRMAAHFQVPETEITADTEEKVLRLGDGAHPYGGTEEWRSRALVAESKLKAIRALLGE